MENKTPESYLCPICSNPPGMRRRIKHMVGLYSNVIHVHVALYIMHVHICICVIVNGTYFQNLAEDHGL